MGCHMVHKGVKNMTRKRKVLLVVGALVVVTAIGSSVAVLLNKKTFLPIAK